MAKKSSEITVFEITGDEIVGGDSEDQNDGFLKKAQLLQDHAAKIGGTLGMTEVTLGTARCEFESIGFRFATNTGDRFDVKGVAIADHLEAHATLKYLR